LRTTVIGALHMFWTSEHSKSPGGRREDRRRRGKPVRPCPAKTESRQETADAAVIDIVRAIQGSAAADAQRVGEYVENMVDYLDSISCTSKLAVEDYLRMARRTLASLYLAASRPRPSPSELTRLALRFTLDPRHPVEGDVGRFGLERIEGVWKVTEYPSLAMKVPAIPLPGIVVRNALGVQILDHLAQDRPQIYKLMELIETLLSCIPTKKDGLGSKDGVRVSSLPPEIRVDLSRSIVWIDEEPVPVSTEGAYFAHAVAGAKGRWISFSSDALSEEHREAVGSRPDRVRRRLPLELGVLFEAQGGKGFRLCMT
jgi:hypothetical protein